MLVKPTSFILRVIVIFLVASTFIFLVDPISNLFDTRDWNVALQAMKEPAFAFHSLRSVVIGVVLTVITELMFRLFGLNDEYVATIIDLKKELEKILDQARASTSALIAYQKFQPLLMLANSGLNPRFNSQIMAHAFREPKLAIPEASYRKYLITLIEANETAEIWRGVHVGSVDPLFGTNLDEDTRKLMAEYLKTLSKVRDKKRIVIRTEGKDDDWLADPQKVRRFLDITGLTTTSYYIRRSTATIILGDKGVLVNWERTREDTAIYDNQLSIRFTPYIDVARNDNGTIYFELVSSIKTSETFSPEMAYFALFGELEREVSNRKLTSFVEIKEGMG